MLNTDELYASLRLLVETAAVSGNEEPLAVVIAGALEERSGRLLPLRRDGLGNRWLHVGPEGEPQRLLLAHMDEIGQRISSIRDDGLCTLTQVGGSDPQLWEGTPVVVHTAAGPRPGCIAPISHHVTFSQGAGPKDRLTQRELYLDLGTSNREELHSLGVRLLDPVTWPKQLWRLAGNVVQGRSLDDRFGCCALLEAALQLLADPPPVPTVLAWTVQEEIGLRGARALAARFTHCAEVIAIDSFCIGSGPRDNKQFTSAQLGNGPVLRSFDSTTLLPDVQRRAVLDKAQGLGIDPQTGYMPGGNDASMFEASGARVFGFSIPVQYSHTNVERVNLLDLAGLVRLITAWCGTAV
jgi:putative aminopeptidase FrvX